MMDNKNIFIIRLTKLIMVNQDHIMLRRTETENSEPLFLLPPLPVLKDQDEDSANQFKITMSSLLKSSLTQYKPQLWITQNQMITWNF